MPPHHTCTAHRLIALSLLLMITLTISTILGGCRAQPQSVNVEPGLTAPDFTLEAVRGGSYQLETLRDQVVLLSFLNTQADESTDPSRSQIVFLKSMQEQYGPKGTVTLIADASRLATGKPAKKDDLTNFTYDWQLDAIPVLMDDRSNTVARQYSVTELPTTFLIDTEGVVQQRWDGFASASQLALALEALAGPPPFRETEATALAGITCPGETPAQAKFAGVGLARPLSGEIWAVDGGQVWGVGSPWPMQWIILDRTGKAQGNELHLQVTAAKLDSDVQVPLVSEDITLLPADEAKGLLAGSSDSIDNVYLLATSVTVQEPGCYQIEATVTHSIEGTLLYTGQAVVPAD